MKAILTALLFVSLITNATFLYVFLNKDYPPAPVKTGKPSLVIDAVGEDNPLFLTGVLKKEVIPKELELGDFWYWLYLDDPVLQTINAVGVPLYLDKIQLFPPRESHFYDIDSFVEKNVEVYGYQTWGLAESSVFQVLSLRTLQ